MRAKEFISESLGHVPSRPQQKDLCAEPTRADIPSQIRSVNKVKLTDGATVTVNGKRVELPGGGSFNYTTPTSASPAYRSPASSGGAYQSPGPERVLFSNSLSSKQKNIFINALADAKRILNAKGLGWLTQCTFHFGSNYKGEASTYRASVDEVHMATRTIWSNAYYGSVRNNILHELGHRFQYKARNTGALDREVSEKYAYYLNSNYRAFPDSYSRTNRNEFWADCFYLWTTNQIQYYHQADWVRAMIKEHNR
jgi:hypothetical protein